LAPGKATGLHGGCCGGELGDECGPKRRARRASPGSNEHAAALK